MKITKVETIRVENIPPAIWVQIYTDNGYVGLGETHYGARTVEAAIHELFVPLLIGSDPLNIERHWNDMFRLSNHWGYGGAETRAISAIDIALWDIAGQAMNQPIYKVLGGACRDRIRVYHTGGGPEYPDDPVPFVKELLNRGITAMKVGMFPPGYQLGVTENMYDFAPVKIKKLVKPIGRIREAVGDAMQIAVDGNGAWSLHNAIRIAQELEPYDILWLEEMLAPLNVDANMSLAQATKIPVCLAERLITRYQHREYIEKGVSRIVMPDLVWTGGISEVKKIAVLAETYQTPVVLHDLCGPVNMFACAHILMNIPNGLFMEHTQPYVEEWYNKFITPNVNIEEGHLLAPEGPGLGTKLRPEVRKRDDVRIQVSDQPSKHYLTEAYRIPGRQRVIGRRRADG